MQTKRFFLSGAPADSEVIRSAADILIRGGLLAFPTETVYGLGADARNADAVKGIFEAKGRPGDNPLIVHVSGIDDVAPLVTAIPPEARQLADRFWPGPLTMILPASGALPGETTAGLRTVALRVPSHPVARELLKAAGIPIAAPSANRSGSPSPTTAQHVLSDLDGRIDGVLDGGPCDVGLESTVLDLTCSPPVILRPGGVTPEMIATVLPDVALHPERPVDEHAEVRSPGMKYRHYAPSSPVTAVRGDAEDAAAYIRHAAASLPGDSAVLCFTGEAAAYPGLLTREYGAESRPDELARNLFTALRDLDSLCPARIFARLPRGGGVAIAVTNRLLRAASFDVVDV